MPHLSPDVSFELAGGPGPLCRRMDQDRPLILVVDDDPALAEMLGIVLRGEGFEPSFVADGDKALAAFREAARATFVKNKRVNIRLSAADLMDLQARAYEEGVPYQTLIASVLHKYVSGRLRETKSRLTPRSTRSRAKSARAG